MAKWENITEDMHIHSTFSDGANSVEENIKTAISRGLTRMCCVDHVRRDTDWLPSYVYEVAELREEYADKIEVRIGIEAKFLDENGTLDLPDNLEGIDHIFAADHRYPLGDTVLLPEEVKEMVASGEVSKERLIESLISASISSMVDHENVVIAHFLSILPKVDFLEDDVPTDLLEALGTTASYTRTPIDVNERWKCPGSRVISILHDAGAELWFGTDAHSKEKIGVYDACKRHVSEALGQDRTRAEGTTSRFMRPASSEVVSG